MSLSGCVSLRRFFAAEPLTSFSSGTSYLVETYMQASERTHMRVRVACQRARRWTRIPTVTDARRTSMRVRACALMHVRVCVCAHACEGAWYTSALVPTSSDGFAVTPVAHGSRLGLYE